MLQFVNPIWLLAGSAVLIPVIIHLWNIRKGRVLRVGSTLLMTEVTQKASTSLKVSDWLLLLLRCLLIIVLSFILAGAAWQQNNKQVSTGWILIEPELLQTVYSRHQVSIDSLMQAGFELHAFTAGFPAIAVGDTMQKKVRPEPHWSLISRADHVLPAQYPVYLFTDNSLSRLASPNNQDLDRHAMPRPTVSIDLHWKLMETADDTETLFNKRQLANGSYEAAFMKTVAEGAYVQRKTVGESNEADTSTTRILVVSDDKYQQDAHFLQSALHAIARFGNFKMDINVRRNDPGNLAGTDWLFWLSDRPLIATEARYKFIYVPGTPKRIRSWLREADGGIAGNTIKTFKVIVDTLTAHNTATWQDGFGNPVLSFDRIDSTYRFYSRFDPTWSDLPWNPQFPKKLLQLILNNPAVPDGRTFALADAMPSKAKSTIKKNTAVFNVVDLQHWLWLLAFVLFTAERIISIKKKPGRI